MGGGGLVSDVVDAVVLLVRLTVGIYHGGLVAFSGEAIFLQMSLLLAVPAFSVWIAQLHRTVVVTLVVAAVFVVAVVVVPVVSSKTNCSELSELIVRQIVPDNFFCFFFVHFIPDGVNFIEPLMVVLDRFKVASDLDAFSKGVLSSFQDLVADAIF